MTGKLVTINIRCKHHLVESMEFTLFLTQKLNNKEIPKHIELCIKYMFNEKIPFNIINIKKL